MTTLLVDADVLAYTHAAYHEVATEVEPGYWTWYCDFNKVTKSIEEAISNLIEEHEADEVILCLSDTHNFRKDVEPTYKGNRASMKRPLVLKPVREWMLQEKGARVMPGLEGDDVMGILSTSMENTIIVSIDKDMKTIPGFLIHGGELQQISEQEADYWHLYQTLIGDTVDGYSGCPGIGPVKAKEILDKDCSWEAVVKTFEKKKLTEEDALKQARLARILRATDYNFQTGEVILWAPKNEV